MSISVASEEDKFASGSSDKTVKLWRLLVTKVGSDVTNIEAQMIHHFTNLHSGNRNSTIL